jgi:hypothetical protein
MSSSRPRLKSNIRAPRSPYTELLEQAGASAGYMGLLLRSGSRYTVLPPSRGPYITLPTIKIRNAALLDKYMPPERCPRPKSSQFWLPESPDPAKLNTTPPGQMELVLTYMRFYQSVGVSASTKGQTARITTGYVRWIGCLEFAVRPGSGDHGLIDTGPGLLYM